MTKQRKCKTLINDLTFETSAIADHITSTGYNIKWNHFEIPATGGSDIHCIIKES